MFDINVSEFFDNLWELILKSLYDPLYESVQDSFQDLFNLLNYEVTKAADNIKIGPKQWDEQAFATVKGISETVCIPVAAAFITVIFCWELIHLVQESNAMGNAKPEKIMVILLKFGLCLFVCAKSFDIIIGFYDIGALAAGQLGNITSSNMRKFHVELSDILDPVPTKYTVGLLMRLCGYKVILFIGKFGIAVCGVIVYVRVMLWFMEILLYASVSPLPYSTWVNKEWSQVGMNYTRKMLALAFEGFFMLLLFAIYGGVVAGVTQGDFMQNMVMIIGCGFALAVMMSKTGNISASIFNAH